MTMAKVDGLEPKEVLSIDDLTVIAIHNKISSVLAIYEQQILESDSDSERKAIYGDIKALYESVTLGD